MYIVVVQITRIYLGNPSLHCVPHPGRKGLPLYLTADSSVRTMANSTWIELHLTGDTDAPKNGQLLVALATSSRSLRERERKKDLHADTGRMHPPLLGSFFRARRDKGKDIFYRYHDDAISLLIETARGARNF